MCWINVNKHLIISPFIYKKGTSTQASTAGNYDAALPYCKWVAVGMHGMIAQPKPEKAGQSLVPKVQSGTQWRTSTSKTLSRWQRELAPTTGDHPMAGPKLSGCNCLTQRIAIKGSVWLGFPCVSKVYTSKQKVPSIQTVTSIHAIISEPSTWFRP